MQYRKMIDHLEQDGETEAGGGSGPDIDHGGRRAQCPSAHVKVRRHRNPRCQWDMSY